MAKDTHKKEHIEKQLREVGFKNINRIDAVEDKVNGRVGLSKSQLEALSQVSAPFIVLEDDADPKSFKSTVEVPDDADALYLGNSQWGFHYLSGTHKHEENCLREPPANYEQRTLN